MILVQAVATARLNVTQPRQSCQSPVYNPQGFWYKVRAPFTDIIKIALVSLTSITASDTLESSEI
jgi:hypothetical protein